ncbi:MAG: ABC transporter substrate-binding protein [Nitriliruptorales bacterium]|nr:ABC transporter substrate-binding protein [Nitriliruptorales bacterium]
MAIPEAPGHLADPHGDDVAAQDIAALWGLPLYRRDEHGQLRRGLVERARTAVTDGRLNVTLELVPGSWTDGTPVTATDVVETIALRKSGPTAGEWHVLSSAHAVDEQTVHLEFEATAAPAWPGLLGTIGVLPAQARQDLERWKQDVPVSGGWYRLVEHDPGRLLRFEAHGEGPLGAPRLASIDVMIVPSWERALGMLDRREIDAAMGHLAVGVRERVSDLEGLASAAPSGGTWIGLEWRDASLAARRAVGDTVGVTDLVASLLDAGSVVATSPWFGVEGPWRQAMSADASAAGGMVGGYPRGHGAVALLASLLQRQVDEAGGSLRLISENSPEFLEVARSEHDVALRIFRDHARGSLARWTEDPEVLAAELSDDADAIEAAWKALFDARSIEPLVRPTVAHAWRPSSIGGLRPSAWPGIGFWNVGSWSSVDHAAWDS